MSINSLGIKCVVDCPNISCLITFLVSGLSFVFRLWLPHVCVDDCLVWSVSWLGSWRLLNLKPLIYVHQRCSSYTIIQTCFNFYVGNIEVECQNVTELTDVTVLDLGHYVDFLLAADGFFSVEPHYQLPWEYYE